jgi:hypothetical protein
MRFRLVLVERFPATIAEGILYWSKEYEITAHLCACGCGDVVYLPIGPADYSITLGSNGPTLRPSIGNWGVCNAHYFITGGDVQWAGAWTQGKIRSSRLREDARRAAFYAPPVETIFSKVFRIAKSVVGWLGIGRPDA